MKKQKILWVLGLVVCLLFAFGAETVLPHTYSQPLEGVTGLVPDGDDDKPIYRLEGWDTVGGSEEEEYDEEAYDDEEYYEDEYAEVEYSEEEYEEPVYQMTFKTRGKVSAIDLTTTGHTECEVKIISNQGEEDFYIEETGTVSLHIPFEGENEEITFVFSDSQRIIDRVQLTQVGGMNPQRLLILAVTLVSLYLLVTLRKFIGSHLEYGFLIVGAAASILFGALVPFATSWWWDGAIHYEKAYYLGSFFEQMSYGMTFNEWLSDMSVNSANYLISGLSVFLGSALGLSEAGKFLLDRAFSGILYLGVSFLAIRWAKRYKRILTFTALMPVSIFLGISYSYDITINAFSFLAFALMVNELITPEEKLTLKNAALITVSLVIASLPKAIYIPLLALMLLLPRAKFNCKKQHIAYKAGLILVIVMVFAAYALPMLSNPEVYTDSRGSGESSMTQLQYIFSDFFGFIAMLFSNICDGFLGVHMASERNFLAYLKEGSTAFQMITLMFTVYVFASDNDASLAKPQLKPLHKWGMGVISFGIVAMCYAIFYVTFSQTGGDSIRGVQFRYFLPLMPFFGAALQPRGLENRMKKENDYLAVLVFCLLTNVMMVWDSVLNIFYM